MQFIQDPAATDLEGAFSTQPEELPFPGLKPTGAYVNPAGMPVVLTLKQLVGKPRMFLPWNVSPKN